MSNQLKDYPKNLETAVNINWNYKFWDSQPVAKLKENVILDQEINQEIKENNQNPASLPNGFEWINYDFSKLEDRQKISIFLSKFYGIDSAGEFNRQYGESFLEFMSKDRVYIALGVEHKSAPMGCIFGYVQKTQVNRRILDMVDVSLACIHPKLRSKNLLPTLITELRRQFNLLGYKYGNFSTVNYLSCPYTSTSLWNRILNAKILIETGFVKLDSSITLKAVKKSKALPEDPSLNFVKMNKDHIDQAYELFNKYMDKYNVHPIFSKDEFRREFYENKFINTFVLEDNNGIITDFLSYYVLDTNILVKNDNFKNIRRGYLYYYTCNNTTSYKIIQNAIILAKKYGVDVFSALDCMENANVLRELGFDETPTTFHNYVYGLKIKKLENYQVSKLYL